MECDELIRDLIDSSWRTVLAEVENAAVYIDHAAAESLHWYAAGKGYLVLKDAGAVAVQELAMYNFRYAEVRTAKKAVVISTSDDLAFYRRTIKMILAKNAFESCTILCAAPPRGSDYYLSLAAEGTLDYSKLRNDVKEWMSSKKLPQEPSVSVTYVPLFLAMINKDLLITPPFGNVMPPVHSDVTDEWDAAADRLARSFRYLFEELNVREDVYTIGKFSGCIAEKLKDLERKNNPAAIPETGMSFILVDRTLDLSTPTSNNTESLFAKILRTLPHLPHHENDVAINMLRLFRDSEEPEKESRKPLWNVPGCLASLEKSVIEELICGKSKKILIAAHHSLNDMLLAAATASPQPRTASRISGHSLQKMVDKLRDSGTLDSAKLTACSTKLQSTLAVIEAITSDKTSQIELLTSLEKLALQNLSVSRESSTILSQLSNIIRTRKSRSLDMENLLALLIHIYSLAGIEIRFGPQQERCLEDAIADAILEDMQQLTENASTEQSSVYQETLLLLGTNGDNAAMKEASIRIASYIVNTFRAIATQRSALQDYRDLMVSSSSKEPTRRVGILEQIVADSLSPDTTHELRDLRQRSSSFVSAGLNLFLRGRAKRHPRDNQWILIYVVGGVTAEEARLVQEIVSAEKEGSHRVTLSGSKLLNPGDIVDKILLSSINHPSAA